MGVEVNRGRTGNSVVMDPAEEKMGIECQPLWGCRTGLPRLLLLKRSVNSVTLPALAVSCLSGGT